jgi:hypothetical protein
MLTSLSKKYSKLPYDRLSFFSLAMRVIGRDSKGIGPPGFKADEGTK